MTDPLPVGPSQSLLYSLVLQSAEERGLLDIDILDEDDPSEIDEQAAHLFKHAPHGIEDIYEVWEADPIFYPAKAPADWLMVSEVAAKVLVVPLAKPDSRDPSRCRPIGCYEGARVLAERYRADR